MIFSLRQYSVRFLRKFISHQEKPKIFLVDPKDSFARLISYRIEM